MSEAKRPLLDPFQRYDSVEPLYQREILRSEREEQKWEGRFKTLLIALAALVIAAFVLSFLGFWRYRDLRRLQEITENVLSKECRSQVNSPQGQQTFSAKAALPSNLRNQLLLSIPTGQQLQQKGEKKARKPNFLIFLADDLGFGDLAIDGHPTQPWGPLDEMASKGMQFKNFYADAFCTPSRAQLLTGRLAVRSGMQGENPRVLLTFSPGGLPDSEVTIPELLRDNGYATGMTGKWHLGINCRKQGDGCHLPFNHGFQEVGTYFPISNNLVCDETKRYSAYPNPTICFMYKGHGTEPYQAPAYHENLTETLVGEAKDFMTKNRDQPWFYYFASPQTHDVMYSSAKYRGSTPRGDFGDALNEMSWAAGDLVRHLQATDQLQDTFIFFFADNGAPNTDCGQAGNNGLLRSGKGTAWEGGNRATAFAYWPGKIPEGVISHAVTSGADLFPTIAKLAGATPDPDILLDGRDMGPVLFGDGTQSQEDKDRPIFFYCGTTIFAIRYKGYKLHFYTNNDPKDDCYDGQPPFAINPVSRVLARQNCNDSSLVTKQDPPLLFNLNSDPSERYPLDLSTRSSLLAEFQAVIAEHKSKMVYVKDQLKGLNPFLIPCKDLKTGCVVNYPNADQFKFPKRLICILLPQLCLRTPENKGDPRFQVTPQEKEMIREYFPQFVSMIKEDW